MEVPMRRLSLIRLPLISLALITSPLASTSGAVTAPAQQSSGPVIASGRLLDTSSRPTPGTVELLAWPPAESQQVGQEVALVPVAQTQSGSDGRFTLRAADSPVLAALAAANGGYVNLELHALSGGSVEETHFSRYLSPSSLDAKRPQATWLARPDEAAEPVTVRFQRPSGMRAQAVDGSVKLPAQGGCAGLRLLEKTASDTVVGELRTEPDTKAAKFVYGKTADSDISVALRTGGGNWSLSGEHHVANSAGSAVTQNAGRDQHMTVLSSFEYGRYETICPSGRQEKVMPLGWRGGGLATRPTPHRGCSSAPELRLFRFGDNGEFKRDRERAVSWGGAASVFGASLSARSGYSQFVHADWKFGSEPEHLLCGDDGNPSESSHIFAGHSTPSEARCQVGRPC
jgi:hypothetical protein